MFADIPDDEAQYWTSKLEWINTMSVDEEVRVKSAAGPLLRACSALLSSVLQYPLPDQSRQLPFAASQCCEYQSSPSPLLDGALFFSTRYCSVSPYFTLVGPL